MKRKLLTFLLLFGLLLPGFVPIQATRAAPDLVINEIRIDQPGDDNDEYFELAGGANESLNGLTYLVIGDGTGGSGVIEAVVDLTGNSIPTGGFFVAAESTFTLGTADLVTNLNFENSDNVTHLLVRDFSGANGDDLDTDDDGVLDSTPWTELVDLIALVEEENPPGSTEFHYGPPSVGPDGSFVPGQVFLCEDGWRIGSFSSFVNDTPGTENNCAPPAPPVVTIMEIQGTGQFSPLEGQLVETSGVVTLFTANGAHCWLQDPAGDGNAASSDGIFVSGCGFPSEGSAPAVGDSIRIIAQVQEQQFAPALPLTRLTGVQLVEVLSSNNPLPAPVPLVDLPNESILDGIDFWEPLEGMLVSIEKGFVVAPTSGFGEFAMLTEADADADLNSGFFAQTQQILIRSLGENKVDYNPERILVDDSSLERAIAVMPGDRVRSLVGTVDFTFGNYKLQPASFDLNTHKPPNLPASKRSGDTGDTVITTFNVENLFDLELNIGGVVDSLGQVGFDPGSEWGIGNTSTQDNTIRRQSTICEGDTIESDPFDPSAEWDGFDQNTFDGLGSHTATCGTADDLIISEYVEGSSLNKAIEIYNGTGAAVNLGIGGYAIEIYFNGSNSAGTTIQLSGVLDDGDVFVVADDGADPAILAVADQTSTSNFFNGDDAVVLRKGGKDDASSTPDPDELEVKLAKLAMALQVELELPEILVVQEVENQSILQALGDRVNTAAGTAYTATSFETSDGRGIEPGFLWDANRVSLRDAFQLNDAIVPGVSDAFGLTSPSPGREPIVGVFEIGGLEVTIVGNHFKSKSGDDPLFGVNWPPVRVTEAQRKAQAQVVRDYVNIIFDADPDALVMVAGDLNDFQFGEPGEGPDHPLAILAGMGDEVPLTNLLNLEKEAETFTFIFDGNSQVLDHMLVSPALLEKFAAVDILHFNASFPAGLSSAAGTPLRAADHDPLEGRFRLK